jgi:group I intron endonuclease
MTSCIYTITNKINHKIYVGKTNHFTRRKNQHKRALQENRHGNIHLQRAWNTYGEENFLFETLEEYPNEYLYAMEHYWCNLLDNFNYDRGYNEKPTHPMNKGGNSLAAIEKVRQANTGKKASKEAKEKMSIAKI